MNLTTRIAGARLFRRVTSATNATALSLGGSGTTQTISLGVPDDPILVELTPAY